MWNHSQRNAYPEIILHDCNISAINMKEGVLSFTFDDGFWVTLHHRLNHYGKVLRTGKSEITYCEIEDAELTVYLFEENRKSGQTIRKEIPFAKLLEQVNKQKWMLELVNEFYGLGSALLTGYIKAASQPYTECQITLQFKEAVYHWNEMLEHREW